MLIFNDDTTYIYAWFNDNDYYKLISNDDYMKKSIVIIYPSHSESNVNIEKLKCIISESNRYNNCNITIYTLGYLKKYMLTIILGIDQTELDKIKIDDSTFTYKYNKPDCKLTTYVTTSDIDELSVSNDSRCYKIKIHVNMDYAIE